MRADSRRFERVNAAYDNIVLLRDGPPPRTTGTIVDLGCGYGPITVALGARSAAKIMAVDVNERARELCRENADAAGLTSVVVLSPDEVPDDLRVDEIWIIWLGRLVDGGRAVLVVQRHLGADSLATWLEDQGWTVERSASRQGYRLLGVTRA